MRNGIRKSYMNQSFERQRNPPLPYPPQQVPPQQVPPQQDPPQKGLLLLRQFQLVVHIVHVEHNGHEEHVLPVRHNAQLIAKHRGLTVHVEQSGHEEHVLPVIPDRVLMSDRVMIENQSLRQQQLPNTKISKI